MNRLLQTYWKNCSGAALVETAIVLPLALGLLAGSVEFGRAFYAYHAADQALRDAARYMARISPTDTPDQTAAITRAIAQIKLADSSATVTIPSPTFPSNRVHLTATVNLSFTLLSILGLRNPVISLSHDEPYIGE